jgi:DNA replication protein DnaC
MRRHELKSTMMTSNRPLEDWGKLIGDIPSATAILDRFLHRSELFQITGRSYRLGSSENNSKRAKALTGSEADKEAIEQASKRATNTEKN